MKHVPSFASTIFAMALLSLSSFNTSASAQAPTVTRIEGGAFHSLFLESDGSLWAMGDNAYGQLGDGSYNNAPLPERILPGGVTAIASGAGHSLFLKSDGSLWAVGYNIYGQLGDGTNDGGSYQTNLPEQIESSNVTAIAVGAYHSLFLKSDGSLWGMGDDTYGQLGDGCNNSTNLPKLIVPSNVTAIAAGGYHSLFLKGDGSLWAMGNNNYGQLGDGSYNNTNLPEMIAPGNVTAIAGGLFHSMYLKSDGSLWAMGNNYSGQLGDGSTDGGAYETNLPEMIESGNVTAIAAGDYHSLFLMSNGSLWVMGDNYNGQLGDGTYNSQIAPEMIVSSNATAIAAGGYHSLILKNGGSLWATGYNPLGALGSGPYQSQTDLPEEIVPFTPTVQFSASPTNGSAPLAVQFATTNVDSFSYPITNWNWKFGDGSASTNQNPSHTYPSNGLFQVSLVATNVAGDAVTAFGPDISVGSPPVILTQPQSLFVSNGLPATFTVAVTNGSSFSFQWQLNGSNLADGGNISGSATSNLALSATSSNSGGNYMVAVNNSYGAVTSSMAVLTVILPGIFPPRFETTVVSNGAFQFTWNSANTSPPVGYQVQYTTNLAKCKWTNLGGVITGPGPSLGSCDTNNTEPQRFYRILLVQ